MNVEFNSMGGSLVGGIRLGRVIRSLGMKTSVAKTVADSRFYKRDKGVCFSACAYAFLGGAQRWANSGEYGVHQFYTDALLNDPNGKVFSPVDFSAQQTLTGLLLSYVIEMGASGELVVEANRTPPTEMNLLTKKQLADFRVDFDPKSYGDWKLEAYRNGLITYSRTQDGTKQMTLLCDSTRSAKLIIFNAVPVGSRNDFKMSFNKIEKFTLLNRAIERSTIRLEEHSTGINTNVPITAADLDSLEKAHGAFESFSVHTDEPRVFQNFLYERISVDGLASSVRLVRRNCIK